MIFSGRVSSGIWPRMTMRSKQWYAKASRLPNSVAKVSIARLPLLLPQQQDHRTDGLELNETGGKRKVKCFKGKKPLVLFPCSEHNGGPEKRNLPVLKISNILGSIRPLSDA